jgi:Glyoxalase-like domain
MATFELDHLFVCTSVDAPEGRRLIELGLTEGTPNTHPGQGTANRRFFFRNAMLELIWVHDSAEANSPVTRRTRLFDRWRDRASGACPFAFCFRPADGSVNAPFATWAYVPSYVAPSMAIHIGANSDRLSEPMLCFMSSAIRPDEVADERRQPMDHAIGVREITRVRWTRPSAAALSPQMSVVASLPSFTVETGDAHALEIGFDHESSGQSRTLHPELPITFFW